MWLSQAHAGFPMLYSVVFILCSIVSDKRWLFVLFKLSFHTLTLKIKPHAMYHHEILINNKVYNLLDRPFNFKAMESFSHEKKNQIFLFERPLYYLLIWPTFLVEIWRVRLLNLSFQVIFYFRKKHTLTSRTIAAPAECCLTPSRQFCSYITTRTMYFLTRWQWCRLLCTRPKRLVGFKLTDRHVARNGPNIMAGLETTNICPFSVMMRAA